VQLESLLELLDINREIVRRALEIERLIRVEQELQAKSASLGTTRTSARFMVVTDKKSAEEFQKLEDPFAYVIRDDMRLRGRRAMAGWKALRLTTFSTAYDMGFGFRLHNARFIVSLVYDYLRHWLAVARYDWTVRIIRHWNSWILRIARWTDF
jgi:hypothetical protein